MFEILNRPHADPTPLPLTISPWPIITILASYLLFVLKLGRVFMDKRKPFELRKVLKAYNLIQILYNGLLFIGISYYIGILSPYNLNCLTVMPLDHPLKNTERLLAYAFYINKIVDLLDTIFIVLRKSYRQISVLHLVHHVYMAAAGYICIRLNGYGGHLIITGYLNLLVHTVMYGYYYLASQSTLIKQNLWWKQYITILQMVQFVIIFGHSAWTLMQPNCGVSIYIISLCLFMSAFMFVMFANFYRHSYIMPRKKTLKEKL